VVLALIDQALLLGAGCPRTIGSLVASCLTDKFLGGHLEQLLGVPLLDLGMLKLQSDCLD